MIQHSSGTKRRIVKIPLTAPRSSSEAPQVSLCISPESLHQPAPVHGCALFIYFFHKSQKNCTFCSSLNSTTPTALLQPMGEKAQYTLHISVSGSFRQPSLPHGTTTNSSPAERNVVVLIMAFGFK